MLIFLVHTEKERVRLVKRSWESVGIYCSSLGRQVIDLRSHTQTNTPGGVDFVGIYVGDLMIVSM